MDTSRLNRYVVLALSVLALLYAALAGLRTVGDLDIGWQLATGRYLVEHRQVPYHEVFTYTARGQEWIYPPFSGLFFYGLYSFGGFSIMSWFCAASCAGVVALLLRGGSLAGLPQWPALVPALAIVAVPAIALRAAPRADLFSTVLFAAFFSLLWQQFRRGRAPLWLLPLLMLAWVNLHLGFAAGLLAIAAYLLLELLELPFAKRRAAALARLRRSAAWLAATVAATLVNPWGLGIYAGLVQQDQVLKAVGPFIGYWRSTPLSLATAAQALAWRSPESGYWWLLLVGLVLGGLSAWRRQLGAALVLAGAVALSLSSIRFHGLLAVVVVLAAGWLWPLLFPRRVGQESQPEGWRPRVATGLTLALLAAMLALVGFRVSDLVSNRHYLSRGDTSVFGPGVSWWFPERAASFILRERPPGQVFNDYNLGGYLIWRLGPHYPVYFDGRAIPFGVDHFFRLRTLMNTSPDSRQWQQEADRYGINTLIFSLARSIGMGGLSLRQLCDSPAWRPVYLDEVAVVLVRNREENARWLERLEINCDHVELQPPRTNKKAELFAFYANAAGVFYRLGRYGTAFEAVERAHRIFPRAPNLYLLRAQLLEAHGRFPEAKQQLRASLELRETEAGWAALGRTHALERRYPQSARAFRRAALLSFHPYYHYLTLGKLYLAMDQASQALEAFQDAERLSPFGKRTDAPAAAFLAQVAAGRAQAWKRLGDGTRALASQERAARLTPQDPILWLKLAELYQALGREESARQARARAWHLNQSIR